MRGKREIGTPLDDDGFAMAFQPDGKIIVGGQSGGDLVLGRFNADGSVDTSFGGDGLVLTNLGGTEQINSLVIQSDGAIVVGGLLDSDFVIARFTSAGALDEEFGTDGFTTTDISGTDAAYSLSRQADGKYVAAGVSNSGDFGIVRYDAEGALDTSFNTTGILTVDFGGTDTAYALAVGPDFNITVAGESDGDFAVSRVHVAGALEQRMYAITDINHNVTAVTDVYGNVNKRFVYDPYGAATALPANWSTPIDGSDWVYRHQGLRHDTVSNSDDERNRIDLVALGRPAQADPSGYPDGANRYQDRGSNPVSFVDPFGLQAGSPTTNPVAQPTANDSLINQLGADSWTQRESAQAELQRRANQDPDLMKKLQRSRDTTNDEEIRSRICVILRGPPRPYEGVDLARLALLRRQRMDIARRLDRALDWNDRAEISVDEKNKRLNEIRKEQSNNDHELNLIEKEIRLHCDPDELEDQLNPPAPPPPDPFDIWGRIWGIK